MSDEYRIIDEHERNRPPYYGKGYVNDFEKCVSESESTYNLEAFNDSMVDSMVRFVRYGYEPLFSPETFEKILKRVTVNKNSDILTGPEISRCIEDDPIAGVLLMCRQVETSLCGLYELDPDSPMEASNAMLMAVSDGVLKKSQIKTMNEMMRFRKVCSERLDAEAPSEAELSGWYDTTLRTIAACYKAGCLSPSFLNNRSDDAAKGAE